MNREQLKTSALLDLHYTRARELLLKTVFPWEAIPKIGEEICRIGKTLPKEIYEEAEENVWIARDAVIAASASITGPCIIGEKTEIRHCAFLRGNVLAGDGAVIGNSTELKNVILFDQVQVPHYNYVGDSILGFCSHMGAGAITSNLKSDHSLVAVRTPEEKLETGLIKFGAVLGDHVEVGCGTVLNPGSVIGKNTTIYPLSMVRGWIPEGTIYKHQGEVAEKMNEPFYGNSGRYGG